MRQRAGATGPDRKASRAAINRLSLYLRQLESLHTRDESTVSSSQLGQSLGLSDAQVRKDLAFFGQFGQPGVGYAVGALIPALRHILGIDRTWPTAMIGMGNLGRALLRYRGFRSRGFHIVALFDNDDQKVGRTHSGLKVHRFEDLPRVCERKGITLAILCVPAEVAQQVADQVVACRVRGILNFAPVKLVVPPQTSVMSVDLSVQLETLAYQVQSVMASIPAGRPQGAGN